MSQDMPRTSTFTGVIYMNKGMHGKWKATIKHQGKKNMLGVYDFEEEAARAFDRAAIRFRGTGARTNFPIADYNDEIASLTQEPMDADALAAQPAAKRARTSHPDAKLSAPPTPFLELPLLITTSKFKPKAPLTDVRPTPINAGRSNPALDAVQSAIKGVMKQPLETFMVLPEGDVNHRQQRALHWCRSQLTAAQQASDAGIAHSAMEQVALAVDRLTQDGADKHTEGASAISNAQQHAMLIGSNLQFSGPPPPQQPQDQQQQQQHGVAAYRIGADGQRKYRGVSWVPDKSKWRAQLSVPGQKKMHLGYFASVEEAAAAYDAAAYHALGSAAHLNFADPSFTSALGQTATPLFVTGTPQPDAPGTRPRGRPKKNAGQQQEQQQQQAMLSTPQPQAQHEPHSTPGAATGAGSGAKKSKFMGVSQLKCGSFVAHMKEKGGNKVRLGGFFSEEEAARAYDRAVLQARGPGAKTNFTDYPELKQQQPPHTIPGHPQYLLHTRKTAPAGASPVAFSVGYPTAMSQQPAAAMQLGSSALLQPQAATTYVHQTVPQPGLQPAAPAASQPTALAGMSLPSAHMHQPQAAASAYTYAPAAPSNGTAFATLDSHPMYTFAQQPAPGQPQYGNPTSSYPTAYASPAQPMQPAYATASRVSNSSAQYAGQWPYWGRS